MTPRKNGGPWRQGNLLAFPGCKKSLPPPSPFLPLLHTPPGRLRRPCSSYSGSRRRCRRQSRQKCLFSPRLVSFLFLFFAGAKRQLKKRSGMQGIGGISFLKNIKISYISPSCCNKPFQCTEAGGGGEEEVGVPTSKIRGRRKMMKRKVAFFPEPRGQRTGRPSSETELNEGWVSYCLVCKIPCSLDWH